MNRSFIQLMSIAIILSCISSQAFSQNAPAQPAQPKPYTVKPVDFKLTLKVGGILESLSTEEISVKPEVWKSFKVVEAVEQGTKVNAGDVLIRFDSEDLDKAIKEGQRSHRLGEIAYQIAELDFEEAQYSTKEKIESVARKIKQDEEDREYYLEVTRANTLRNYKESYISSLKRLEQQQEELNQLKKMYEEDDLTEETEEIILKRQQRSVELAKFSAELAKQRYDRTLSTLFPRQEAQRERNEEAQKRANEYALKTLPLSLEQKQLTMEKTRIDHEKAVEKYQNLKKDRELLVVKAPVSGVVYYGQANNGSWSGTVASRLKKDGMIKPEEVFMTIVDTKANQIQSSISESQLYLAKKGIEGTAKVVAYPKASIPVKLKSIDRIPTSGGKFPITLEVDHAGAKNVDMVLPGYSVNATLTAYHNKEALAIPSDLIHTEDDNPDSKYVFVKNGDDKPTKQPVTTGLSSGGKTEILTGIKAGDKIVPKA